MPVTSSVSFIDKPPMTAAMPSSPAFLAPLASDDAAPAAPAAPPVPACIPAAASILSAAVFIKAPAAISLTSAQMRMPCDASTPRPPTAAKPTPPVSRPCTPCGFFCAKSAAHSETPASASSHGCKAFVASRPRLICAVSIRLVVVSQAWPATSFCPAPCVYFWAA